MPFLHEKLDVLRENGYSLEMPSYIPFNLNNSFELRPYQIRAFENFITYFESNKCPKPTQVLFHMATGSGKTLIMAGLMLYLYKQGYRNFLFFVNLSTIVKKTEDNFMNPASIKYLFAEDIVLDEERIAVKQVKNFQASDPDAINICFSTTQGLHTDMWLARENGMSFDDFDGKKTVLISDEAHHLNATTKKMTKDEEESYHSWEQTVKNIYDRNKDNVLLEFTATCDLANPYIKAEYEHKIIFDYPLSKFRTDLYSKEIKTLRSDMNIMDRIIQALVLSQYRLKIFQDNHLSIKPVVLLKASKVSDSKEYFEKFNNAIKNLNGQTIERIADLVDDDSTMNSVYSYFKKTGITMDMLAQELREDFSEEHCVSVNDDSEAENLQIMLNTLEDSSNPYRAIFEVKKLDEGWDVLNLFDIVRLYETRQSGGKKSNATVSEAQLIGRGARYCPFQIDVEQPKYQRKYDNDVDNPLRICEELYYHCQNDSRYITELHNALREIGIEDDKVVTRRYILKEEFKKDDLYKSGIIFLNERVVKSRKDVDGLLPSVRDKVHTIVLATGQSGEDLIMDDSQGHEDSSIKLYSFNMTIKDVASINYAIVNKALAKNPIYKFNSLKSRFPNLKSTREFIMDGNYLGNIRIELKSKYENPPLSVIASAVQIVISKLAVKISEIGEEYEGTKQFRAVNVRDVFSDKAVNYTKIAEGGIGVSQNDITVPMNMRIDLNEENWFAFTDNFGTSEEKAFVSYFKEHVTELKEKYSKIYLIRNERQIHIYSFNSGERFEPDYVLFLQKNNSDGFEQFQVFIEPKGTHLIENDKWKEDFLLQLRDNAIPIKTFVDDNNYHIWGFHFYNRDKRKAEFDADFHTISNADGIIANLSL